LDPFAGLGVDKSQSVGVQGLTSHGFYAFPHHGIFDGSGFRFPSIERIPEDGVTHRSEVNTNLMGATRLRREFEKRNPFEPL
jgi:hypothetical protein